MTLIQLSNLAIIIFGAGGIFLANSGEKIRKYGCLAGIAGQPFWFHIAYSTGSWGVFVTTCLYACAWIWGIYNNWIKPKRLDPFKNMGPMFKPNADISDYEFKWAFDPAIHKNKTLWITSCCQTPYYQHVISEHHDSTDFCLHCRKPTTLIEHKR